MSFASKIDFAAKILLIAATANLLGTIRTLDSLGVVPLNCTYWEGRQVAKESLHCEWAVIGRAGWAIYDDSTNWGLDSNDWWQSPNKDDVDVYFFGHGHDYKGAIRDYVSIGGRVAIPPRYMSGVFFTRWCKSFTLSTSSPSRQSS